MKCGRRITDGGAALILALVLLAALLLLGLPFLFSQASSFSGTRAFANSARARIGSTNAMNLATALAAYAMTPALRVPRSAADETAGWTSLEATFSPLNPSLPSVFAQSVIGLQGPPPDRADDDGSVALVADGLNLGFNIAPSATQGRQGIYLGARITDEAGKLDPNTMGPGLWKWLLAAVGIADWDDGVVYDATTPANNTGGYVCDANDTIGMLAKALTGVRRKLPHRKIEYLEQLLLADPQFNDPGKLLRLRLTRAELELLRPYLTLHNPRPGRDGAVDLGTVVRVDDDVRPTLWMDSQPELRHPALAIGTVLIGESRVGGVHVVGEINGVAENPYADRLVFGVPYASTDPLAAQGEAVVLQAPAPINLHQMPVPVRFALGGDPAAPVPDPLPQHPDLPKPDATAAFAQAMSPTIASLAAHQVGTGPWTLLDLINPTRTGFELPPLAIASPGTFLIEAAATVTDVLGNQATQELQRQVVQAVPQEYLLERRWTSQGAIEALVAQRFGSRVQSWPVAVERRLGVPPDDPPTAPTSTLPAGLRPRPQADVASIPRARDPKYFERLYLSHLRIDWRAVFGAAGPIPDGQIFDAECFTDPNTDRIKAIGSAALEQHPEAILPDGFHHDPGTLLAYPLTTDFTDIAKQHTALLIERETSDPTHEMGSRHIGLWVKPDDDWDTTKGLITLLEARMPATNAGTELYLPTAGSSDSQNYFGLLYDAQNELLVLALAPPSIEHTGNVATTWPVVPQDIITTVLVDERCLGGSGLPLAPHQAGSLPELQAFTLAYQPNRVLHCFKTPTRHGKPHFRGGQWYHIQVAIASDRPEDVALIVDGMVGQDPARTALASDTYVELQNFGDRCVLPTVALKARMDYEDVRSGADAPPLIHDPVEVFGWRNHISTPTGPSTVALNATAVLPARGVVRIDDEYLSYDGFDATGLLHCQRGVRQGTFVSSPVVTSEFPNTQMHRFAATVAPGGYHLRIPNAATLYRGGCDLGDPFGNGDANPASPHRWAVWAPIGRRPPLTKVGSTWTFAATEATLPIDDTNGVFAQFPEKGIVVIDGKYLYYGSKDLGGKTLGDLSAIDAAPFSITLSMVPAPQPRVDISFDDATPLAVTVISLRATGPDPTELGRYNLNAAVGSDHLLSLLGPDGRVEWVRYDHVVVNHSATDPGAFFLSDSAYSDAASRGRERTAWAGRDTVVLPNPAATVFPADTLGGLLTHLIPVQTELGHAAHWFATGDVVTFMPRTPKIIGAAPQPVIPFQMVVRYAGSDSYPMLPGPAPADHDGNNDYFAFTTKIPDQIMKPQLLPVTDYGLAIADYDVLCGPCWSGLDLSAAVDNFSQAVASPQPRGQLPRLDCFSTNFLTGGNSDARVVIASTDPGLAGVAAGIGCTIDGISAGGLTHAGVGLDGHERRDASGVISMAPGIAWLFKNGAPIDAIGPALADIDDLVVAATTPMFDYSLGEMGLVRIDGEVFAYQRPTQTDATLISAQLATVQADPLAGSQDIGEVAPYGTNDILGDPLGANRGHFARLIARGLLDATTGGLEHRVTMNATLSDGPFLPATPTSHNSWPHWPALPALRLPLGPVLDLNGKLTDDWFPLVSRVATPADPTPPPATLYAPAALVCGLDGDPAATEIVQLVGPKLHVDPPASSPVDPKAGMYATDTWLRGLYATPGGTAWGDATHPAIAIGWWPRYASALPDATTRPHFRCRTYSWVGFPFAIYGGYFSKSMMNRLPKEYFALDATNQLVLKESLARVEVEPLSLFRDDRGDFFTVEARAAADADVWSGQGQTMDWSEQGFVSINGSPDAAGDAFEQPTDKLEAFTRGGKPRPVDGAELRVNWRYRNATASGALEDIADASGRAPTISSARLRCLAPVRVVSVEK